MIVLDHNITREQAELLARSRVRFRRIGVEIGFQAGMMSKRFCAISTTQSRSRSLHATWAFSVIVFAIGTTASSS